jgi:hypothetical protein
MSTFHFDPRMLISGPFRDCPKCGKPEFGVLSISGNSCSRRCRECFHSEQLPLWPLEKKVIYIDQFAISNMMKAIDDTLESHDRTAADPFWLELFEALERVCKLQLAICPDSEARFAARQEWTTSALEKRTTSEGDLARAKSVILTVRGALDPGGVRGGDGGGPVVAIPL